MHLNTTLFICLSICFAHSIYLSRAISLSIYRALGIWLSLPPRPSIYPSVCLAATHAFRELCPESVSFVCFFVSGLHSGSFLFTLGSTSALVLASLLRSGRDWSPETCSETNAAPPGLSARRHLFLPLHSSRRRENRTHAAQISLKRRRKVEVLRTGCDGGEDGEFLRSSEERKPSQRANCRKKSSRAFPRWGKRSSTRTETRETKHCQADHLHGVSGRLSLFPGWNAIDCLARLRSGSERAPGHGERVRTLWTTGTRIERPGSRPCIQCLVSSYT